MTRYNLNEQMLKYYMDLNYLSNCSRVEFDDKLIKRFEKIIVIDDISIPVFTNIADIESDDEN